MRLFNTLSGQKEEFRPQGDPVRMYVCGVTPYDEAHVGHGMSYIVFDVIRRYLEFRGFRIHHVQNFTDIDDKLIARAQHLGVPALELADRYIARYFEDMEALHVQRAHIYPRVTAEIPAIIEMVKQLEEKGYAYATQGDVYFRVRLAQGYGKLSHRSLEGMMAGARVEVDETKEHPMDFVLWKAAKPGEPQWESPWGPGRPGWHIECSAMSVKYLGDTLDIHGGGQDLTFPHHENEIAQSESVTGIAPFARYWVHNGLLHLGEDKMSKSLGNLVTLRELLERHRADALRLFVLTSHYRSPLTYTEETLAAAERGTERLAEALRPVPTRDGTGQALEVAQFSEQFNQAMDDDFNTPQAVAALFDLAREINRGKEMGAEVAPAQRLLQELSAVLGFTLTPDEEQALTDAAPFIELLVQLRNDLRSARNYPLADKIRQELAAQGVTLEDTASGTSWRQRR